MVAYKNNLSSTERIDPSMDFKLLTWTSQEKSVDTTGRAP